MTTLVHICAWLFANPRFARLWLSTRALLRQLVRCLVDPETGQLRDLPLGAGQGIDRCLQLAETCVTRLIWLRAREIAGLPHIPNTRNFTYIPPRRLRDAQACAVNALNLLDRFWRIELHARRLAARMSQHAELTRHTPQQPKPETPTTLILRTRKARGLEGWKHAPDHPSARRSATLIPQTGPPHTLDTPSSTSPTPRSAIPRFRRQWRTPISHHTPNCHPGLDPGAIPPPRQRPNETRVSARDDSIDEIRPAARKVRSASAATSQPPSA